MDASAPATAPCSSRSGRRVNYIVIDDIDDDEMVLNPARVEKSTDWCLSALYGTMDAGRGRFVLVGNRIGKKSVLGNIAERPGFHHTVVNILDKKGNPTWKENFTKNEVERMRSEIGERRFQKEYMNNPVNEGTIFERKYIRYGKMLPLRQYRAIVAYTDPSFKASSSNDYKATIALSPTRPRSRSWWAGITRFAPSWATHLLNTIWRPTSSRT